MASGCSDIINGAVILASLFGGFSFALGWFTCKADMLDQFRKGNNGNRIGDSKKVKDREPEGCDGKT